MNHLSLTLALGLPLTLCVPVSLKAAEDDWPGTDRFRLSYRMAFNISAEFHNRARPAAANNPSVNGKSYVDGFVGTDDTGNAGGLTTFWGYQKANLVAPDNSVLVMRNASSSGAGEADDSPHHGFELAYNHEFGRSDRSRWGIEAAFGYTSFSSEESATARSADAFALGYEPPSAPHTGTPTAGPFTPLLGTTATPLTGSVDSELDATLYGIRVGPYVDFPCGERFLVTLSAGLVVTVVDGEFSYTESYALPGGGQVVNRSSSTDTSAVVGGFLGANVTFKLSERLSAVTGLEFQRSQAYDIKTGDMEAEVNFNGAFYWSAGVSLSF